MIGPAAPGYGKETYDNTQEPLSDLYTNTSDLRDGFETSDVSEDGRLLDGGIAEVVRDGARETNEDFGMNRRREMGRRKLEVCMCANMLVHLRENVHVVSALSDCPLPLLICCCLCVCRCICAHICKRACTLLTCHDSTFEHDALLATV